MFLSTYADILRNPRPGWEECPASWKLALDVRILDGIHSTMYSSKPLCHRTVLYWHQLIVLLADLLLLALLVLEAFMHDSLRHGEGLACGFHLIIVLLNAA